MKSLIKGYGKEKMLGTAGLRHRQNPLKEHTLCFIRAFISGRPTFIRASISRRPVS
jgi:hypothetical protein